MKLLITEDQTFTRITPSVITSHNRTFENCRFVNSDLSYADLGSVIFVDCTFEGCNLLLVKLADSALQNVRFKECKVSGVDFSKSRDFLFEVHFNNCILDNAIFFKKRMKGADFTDCQMIETDLTEADLTDAQFKNCNLNRAFFNRTQLKNADLRTSYNFIIDPNQNFLKKTKFSIHGLPGLLAKYDIKIEG